MQSGYEKIPSSINTTYWNDSNDFSYIWKRSRMKKIKGREGGGKEEGSKGKEGRN